MQAALELNSVADHVFLVVREGWNADLVLLDKLSAADKVEMMMGFEARKIEGGETVERLTVESAGGAGSIELAVGGIFVEIGLIPNTEFCRGLTDLNEWGEIIADCRAGTGVPGLFAAGDVTTVPYKQIVIAVGEGAKASLSAFDHLIRS